jgi:peptidoglycan/LPS O-acetylase OafA/YrhL
MSTRDDSLRINNFDLLRLLAATQVMFAHGVPHLGLTEPSWWPQFGLFPGVPIFFAISGFLITASFERNSDLRDYFRNRALRIYPGLWCCVLATVVTLAVFGFSVASERGIVWCLCQLGGAIYTPSFLRSFGFGSYNGALWTIPIELQFYVAIPFVFMVLHRVARPNMALLGLWIVFLSIGLAAVFVADPLAEPGAESLTAKLFRYSFIPHFYMFLAGACLYRFNAHRTSYFAARGVYWLVAYSAAVYTLPASPIFTMLKMTMLACVAISLAYTLPMLSSRLLRGYDISYGVYIYHGLALNIAIELAVPRTCGLLAIIAVGVYGAAMISWLVVERPALRRKHYGLKRA